MFLIQYQKPFLHTDCHSVRFAFHARIIQENYLIQRPEYQFVV